MYNILPTPRLAARVGGVGRVELKPFYNRGNFEGVKADGVLRTFVDYADRVFAVTFKSTNDSGEGIINIQKDLTLPDGGYALIVSVDGSVTVAAKDETALSYAFASLLLAAEKTDECFSLPIMHICDEPQGRWRGLMLDIARIWHPIKYIYDAIDLCYLYKINCLQLHLTDDQSYTLPSDAFPSLPSENRHFTKTELASICEYAAERCVTLVPEVDMPGHSSHFNRCYPDVFGENGIVEADEKAFAALETIICETLELFPNAPYIHLGGDEAAIDKWNESEISRAYMSENGIENVHELYAHFLKRVTDFVLSKGRIPVIWEGFSKEYNHMISKEVLIIAWESYYQIAPDLLEGGFTLINCSWKPLYVVPPKTFWAPSEILDWNVFTWRHWWEKSAASKQDIKVPEKSPVIGGQICAWGDAGPKSPSNETFVKFEFDLVRERIPALAEKTWNYFSPLSAEDFDAIYKHTDKVLDKLLRK